MGQSENLHTFCNQSGFLSAPFGRLRTDLQICAGAWITKWMHDYAVSVT